MRVFEAYINHQSLDFLNENLKNIVSLEEANHKLYKTFGIKQFFEIEEDLHSLKEAIEVSKHIVSEADRTEYGDYQTNLGLANKIALLLSSKNISPDIIIEPTCGKGNFILSSLKHFENIEAIIGVEIYKPYVWECKFNIIDFYLNNPREKKPDISIFLCNVFDFNFKTIIKDDFQKKVLIIGNPPWVTNSRLGSLNSTNLPKKTNFKNHSGLDAMTGKGNFDIAEFITLMMVDTFQKMSGNIALLIKNAVIKNIVFDQKKNKFQISQLEKYSIDSKSEFNVSVEASLFCCKLNSEPAFECSDLSNYSSKEFMDIQETGGGLMERRNIRFGWTANKFVSNIDSYFHSKKIDGNCPFEWRQGIKHDCSSVMELDKENGYFVNGLKEGIKLENGLVYGLLKSSDLKNNVINASRKYTIVTQTKVGQETNYIKYLYPETYKYLSSHLEIFNSRKSSIYNNKPSFSIFGIGDYSFKPFKVAISGLYKTFHFTLILPQNEKPLMLDDTCYFIGFDKLEFAVYASIFLNSYLTKEFLQSITFADAKRTFTKDVLMRINFLELSQKIEKAEIQRELNLINETCGFKITLDLLGNFIDEITPVQSGQIELFS